jgi:hypothetical protein
MKKVLLHLLVQQTGPLQHWRGGEGDGDGDAPREGLLEGERLGLAGRLGLRLGLRELLGLALGLREGDAAGERLRLGMRVPLALGLGLGDEAPPQLQRSSFAYTICPSKHLVPGATGWGSYAVPPAQKMNALVQVPSSATATDWPCPGALLSQSSSPMPLRVTHTTCR